MKKTDFGYEQVTPEEKTTRVRGVFSSVAKRYDVMNDFMSAGLHRIWKREAVAMSGVCAGQTVLDLAGGTGDLSMLYAKEVGQNGHVILSDINADMLKEGRDKVLNHGLTQIDCAQINAETLPFQDNTFDCVNIAFGLRNVTHKDRALSSMYRVLKPGGKLIILEFSKATSPLLAKCYDAYSFHVIPKLGGLVTKDSASYQYLVESIRKHPDQKTLETMIQTAGFTNTGYKNLVGGIVAIHYGSKPA